MAELKIAHLDDHVVAALKARARRRGVSLDEEVRATLTAAVLNRPDAFIRRAAAVRASIAAGPGRPERDGARTIREERDAWG